MTSQFSRKTIRFKLVVQILGVLIFAVTKLSAQDSVLTEKNLPFQKEVEEIALRNDSLWDASRETTVFTGSSSVRMWHDVQERFPEQHILNTGFGGSQASDLSYYIYDLILRYSPKKVFVYEGDNDISAKKRPNAVRKTFREIINGIHRNDSTTKVVIISPKPSIARWNLRGKYRRLNRKLERLADEYPLVEFADVWKPMLDGRKVKQDIFIEDGLHMNKKGYDIWFEALSPYVN